MKKEKKPKKANSDKQKKKKNTKTVSALRTDFRNLLADYKAYQERPRYYGQAVPLYIAELKTLSLIVENPQLNLTQLTKKTGTTKSAVSKCTSKLMEKGVLEKRRSEEKLREVVFSLTPVGEAVHQQLAQENAALSEKIDVLFDALSPQTREELSVLFKGLSHLLQEDQTVIKA